MECSECWNNRRDSLGKHTLYHRGRSRHREGDHNKRRIRKHGLHAGLHDNCKRGAARICAGHGHHGRTGCVNGRGKPGAYWNGRSCQRDEQGHCMECSECWNNRRDSLGKHTLYHRGRSRHCEGDHNERRIRKHGLLAGLHYNGERSSSYHLYRYLLQ